MYTSEVIATMSSDLKLAVEALKAGRMVLMVDDEARENEGDLVIAAEYVTSEAVNFMITHARGVLCMPMDQAKAQQLNLPLMCKINTALHGTAFTISIEAKEGVTTGVSASDRARTFLVVASPDAKPSDIATPGHVFPLIATPNGVMERDGHTEGSVDLAKMAGLQPVTAICEILNEDGTMARRPSLQVFAEKYDIPIITIASIKAWRSKYDPVHKESEPLKNWVKGGNVVDFPNIYGGEDLKLQSFKDLQGNEHLAIIKGNVSNPTEGHIPLVRLHSECLTGDVLGSLRCDCGPQLHRALSLIGQSSCGVLLYLRGHEGRGIGLFNKIEAYALQDKGFDTVDANHQLGFKNDIRDWTAAGAMLDYLNIRTFDLLTNNPEKVSMLEQQGFTVAHRISLEMEPNPHNYAYLRTKKERMGHKLLKPL